MDSSVLTKNSDRKAKKVVQLDNRKQPAKQEPTNEPDMKELLA